MKRKRLVLLLAFSICALIPTSALCIYFSSLNRTDNPVLVPSKEVNTGQENGIYQPNHDDIHDTQTETKSGKLDPDDNDPQMNTVSKNQPPEYDYIAYKSNLSKELAVAFDLFDIDDIVKNIVRIISPVDNYTITLICDMLVREKQAASNKRRDVIKRNGKIMTKYAVNNQPVPKEIKEGFSNLLKKVDSDHDQSIKDELLKILSPAQIKKMEEVEIDGLFNQ